MHDHHNTDFRTAPRADTRRLRTGAPAPRAQDAKRRNTKNLTERVAELVVKCQTVRGGRPPLGYMTVLDPCLRTSTRRKVWILDGQYEPIVKLIYDAATEEGLSCPEIASRLNALGYRTRDDFAYSTMAVLRVLDNHQYTGAGVWHLRKGGTTAIQLVSPPIITAEQFVQAQLSLASRNFRSASRSADASIPGEIEREKI